jgi:hypothetical protein
MRRFEHFGGIDGRISGVILASALALSSASLMFAPTAGARQSSQDQQAPPLGTAAKEARAEKPPVAPGKKVWTNDNLPTNPFAISIVGPPAPPEEKPVAEKTKTDEKSAGPEAKEAPKSQTELEALLAKEIEKLALAEKQYDLSKRDFALQQQAFYANARANQDEAEQAQLAEVQKQLDAMLADLEKERAHVAELQLKVDGGQKKVVPAAGEVAVTPSDV